MIIKWLFLAEMGVDIVFLTYENKDSDLIVEWKKSIHFPPHIHEAVEMVYITKGTLELGVGQELYHMEKGDFAIVFPNLIHHYQVFQSGDNKVLYMWISPKFISGYMDEIQNNCPACPVICKEALHVDVVKAVKALVDVDKNNTRLVQAYVQMILAHVFSQVDMVLKETVGSEDLVYKSVEYVAKNFRKNFSMEQMAHDLGVSRYILSRMFSKTFHCNFSTYVNGVRLNYAASLLDGTQEPITNICYDCGFDSQRTFNRVFKNHYRMTPSEYRNKKMF